MKRATATVVLEITKAMEDLDPCDLRNQMGRWILLLSPKRISKVRRGTTVLARRATRKQLDALCREIVFARDGNRCRKCQRTDRQLQWCHVYPKGAHPWLRWDLDNSFCGCAHCHLNWWHGRPLEAFAWWEKEIGPYRWGALVLRAAKPRRTDPILVKIYLEGSRQRA